ncbi:FAD/NAD(P)-binding protein [Micromonospora sp. NPDC004704]
MSRTVLVVGGGCSGVLVSRELLRHTAASVTMVDPAASPGTGVAYGPAAQPWHLLNSPAGTMSADPDAPGDFVDWCRVRRPAVAAGDFMPRSWYGDYLRDVLGGVGRDAPGRLRIVRDRVRRIVDTGGRVRAELESGEWLSADRTVLAIGAPASADPAQRWPASGARGSGYVRDPWLPGALDTVPPDQPVLLVGTGLTAVDVALSLDAAGHRGPMVAVSRHGLLPNAQHRPGPPAPVPTALPQAPESLRRLVRQVRALVEAGADWRAVVDGLRPRLDTYWAGFSSADRDRFLRHLARHWEVHRHRMAPEIADEVGRLRDTGRLAVRAAVVEAIEPRSEGGLNVRLGHRAPASGADDRLDGYGAVVNCTGPGRLPASADPLVRQLLADGLARSGPYGLGLDVDHAGAVLGRDGTPTAPLWTLGSPRRGRLWETTAVPEIRGQARGIAYRFAALDGVTSPLVATA